RARIAENAARSQRAGAKLHAPLKPADHLLVGQQFRDVSEQIGLTLEALVRRFHFVQELLDFRRGKPRTEKASLLGVAGGWPPRPVQELMPDEECSAQRAAGITCGRLDPDIFKWSFAQEQPVGDAIECDAP